MHLGRHSKQKVSSASSAVLTEGAPHANAPSTVAVADGGSHLQEQHEEGTSVAQVKVVPSKNEEFTIIPLRSKSPVLGLSKQPL